MYQNNYTRTTLCLEAVMLINEQQNTAEVQSNKLLGNVSRTFRILSMLLLKAVLKLQLANQLTLPPPVQPDLRSSGEHQHQRMSTPFPEPPLLCVQNWPGSAQYEPSKSTRNYPTILCSWHFGPSAPHFLSLLPLQLEIRTVGESSSGQIFLEGLYSRCRKHNVEPPQGKIRCTHRSSGLGLNSNAGLPSGSWVYLFFCVFF